MQIRWQEMEPKFAGRVRARLCMMSPAPERLSPAWTVFAWIVSALFLVAYVGICFNAAGTTALVGVSLMPVVLMGIALTPAYLTARRAPNCPRHALPRQIPPVLFEKAVRAAPTNVAEMLYGEILVRLHDSDVSVEERKVLLRQCKRLLKQHRELALWIQEESPARRRARASSFTTPNYFGRVSLEKQLEALRPPPHETIPLLEAWQEEICAALDTAWQVLAHKKATAPLLAVAHTHTEVEALLTTLRPIAAREQDQIYNVTTSQG